MPKKIRLSSTVGLGLFLECPRCYWLHMNKGIKRPRGIFPSLPSGMDLVIKKYFDKFRAKNQLPPEIEGKVKGKLFDNLNLLKKWRAWNATDLSYEDASLNACLSGALDDCLVEDGCYMPLDYKTKGSIVKQDPARYYQTQLDCYCLMLESSGYKTNNLAYLLYFSPKDVSQGGNVVFEIHPFESKTDPQRAKKIFEDALNFLKKPMPPLGKECEYCGWLKQAEKHFERTLF